MASRVRQLSAVCRGPDRGRVGGLFLAVLMLTVPILVSCGGATQQVPPAESKRARIGYFSAGRYELSPTRLAFVEGMRDLGYVEGENLHIEYLFTGDASTQLHDRAAELVESSIDVIVAIGTPQAAAVRAVAGSIPIVIASVADPVEAGFIESLARPGTNVTGVSSLSGALAAKRIEFLKTALPGTSRVSVLVPAGWDSSLSSATRQWEQMQTAALAVNVDLQLVEVSRGANPDEIKQNLAQAVARAREGGADSLAPVGDDLFTIYRTDLARLAIEHGLPTIYSRADFADRGGLFAYGPDAFQQVRRAAVFVDRILKGANPSELPVELPAAFEVVVNMKTSELLGISIGPETLLQATRVIQ